MIVLWITPWIVQLFSNPLKCRFVIGGVPMTGEEQIRVLIRRSLAWTWLAWSDVELLSRSKWMEFLSIRSWPAEGSRISKRHNFNSQKIPFGWPNGFMSKWQSVRLWVLLKQNKLDWFMKTSVLKIFRHHLNWSDSVQMSFPQKKSTLFLN